MSCQETATGAPNTEDAPGKEPNIQLLFSTVKGRVINSINEKPLFLFINNSLVFNTMLSRIGNKLYRISPKSALKLHLTDIIL